MASEFIGFTILVTLQSPCDAQIQGIVADVVDQKLYLQNVVLLWNGQRLPSYILDAGVIADVEVATEQHLPHVPAASGVSDVDLTTPPMARGNERENGRSTQTQIPPPERKQTAQFIDPAILSYSKPPPSRPSQPASLQPVSPIMIADGVIPSPLSQVDINAAGGARRVAAKQSSVSSIGTTLPKKGRERRDSQATAVLTEPFDAMALEGEVSVDGRKVGEKKRMGGGKGHKSAGSLTAPGVIDIKDVNGPVSGMKTGKKQQQANAQSQGKGKGWRQTPLIEEIPKQQQSQPKDRRRGRRQPQPAHEDANGWATEDATDIQDLGDFDFASNLSKFDKRQVFDDIRRDDTTADEERLVSFNRLPRARPGTNGGRNLHWTENVLDSPPTTTATAATAGSLQPPNNPAAETWNSEAGETENENEPYPHPLEDHYSSSRGSRRAGSRRPVQSRKGSTLLPMVERVASPRPSQFTKVPAASTTSPMNGSVASATTGVARGGFRLLNGRPCHCVSPLQMLEIEQLCVSEGGLSEDVLSENAGRSIAEAIFKSSSSSTPGNAGAATEVRNVLFLVGNHKSGARAVVAARHLRNRRLRVTVVVLGGEREEVLLESVRKQLTIYRKGGGWVERWDEFISKLSSVSSSAAGTGAGGENGNAPNVATRPRTGLGSEGKGGNLKLDFIVDALLGVHVAFDELRTDDQATCFEMIRWANRISSPSSSSASATQILSIDVPSGLSATTGLSTAAEGQHLVMQSNFVVALGAPKMGLLVARSLMGEEEGGWSVLVADMGISSAAWAKHGSRRSKGVEFGGEWVVGLRFVGA